MAEFHSKAETVLARLGVAEGGDQQSFASR
jgi:hypothetical protein